MIRALIEYIYIYTHTHTHTHTHTTMAPTNAHMYTKISLYFQSAPTYFGQLYDHHQGYNVFNLFIFYRYKNADSHAVGRTRRYELISVSMCAPVGATTVCTFVHNLFIYLTL